MKKLLLGLFLFSAGITLKAQQVNQCGIIIPPSVSIRKDFANVYEAKSYLNNMLDQVNWQQNFQVREQNGINNAYATIIRNQRYIVYDNQFLENLDAYAGTKWASISVLAHEMGHHYYNHIIGSTGSTIPKEIEADFFSGFVMAKMGATLEQAKAAMQQIASAKASSSHPAKADRLDAITRGWNNAKGQTTTTGTTNTTNSTNTTNTTKSYPRPQKQQTTTTDNSWIHLSTYGGSDMTVYLSDDGSQFSTATVKTSQPFVFKYEVYDYGWLRFSNNRNSKTYKLYHNKNYAIVWSRRLNDWTVVEI